MCTTRFYRMGKKHFFKVPVACNRIYKCEIFAVKTSFTGWREKLAARSMSCEDLIQWENVTILPMQLALVMSWIDCMRPLSPSLCCCQRCRRCGPNRGHSNQNHKLYYRSLRIHSLFLPLCEWSAILEESRSKYYKHGNEMKSSTVFYITFSVFGHF